MNMAVDVSPGTAPCSDPPLDDTGPSILNNVLCAIRLQRTLWTWHALEGEAPPSFHVLDAWAESIDDMVQRALQKLEGETVLEQVSARLPPGDCPACGKPYVRVTAVPVEPTPYCDCPSLQPTSAAKAGVGSRPSRKPIEPPSEAGVCVPPGRLFAATEVNVHNDA